MDSVQQQTRGCTGSNCTTLEGTTYTVVKNGILESTVQPTKVVAGATFSVEVAPTQGKFELLDSAAGTFRYWSSAFGNDTEQVILSYGIPGDEPQRVTVNLSLQNLVPKTRYFVDTFSNLNGDGFDLAGWRFYRSDFGVLTTTRASSAMVPRPDYPSQSVRSYGIATDAANLASLASPSDYAPFSSPLSPAGQFPFAAEVLHQPECSTDVELNAPVFWQSLSNQGSLHGALLNFSSTGAGASRKMRGYMILVNPGGQNTTLVRIGDGNDHTFDHLDIWPGYMRPGNILNCPISGLCSNPMTSGPYRNWDYWHTNGFAWESMPAGGNAAELANTIFAQYSFHPITRSVTVAWELRTFEGVDQSPDVWDNQRVLIGEDALEPMGGGFGTIAIHYGGATTVAYDGVNLRTFALKCTHSN